MAARPNPSRDFPIALVRKDGAPVAFAVLWPTPDRGEIAIDLMRNGAEAPQGAMNLGMTPLAGLPASCQL